jgi:hypothetical protein
VLCLTPCFRPTLEIKPKTHLYAHLFKLPFSHFLKESVGETLARDSETDTTRNFVAHDDRDDSPAIASFGLLCVRSLLEQNVGVSLKSSERLMHKTCALLPHFCLLASLSVLQTTCVSDSAKGVIRCSSLSFFQ